MPNPSDNEWKQERIRLTLPNDIAHVGIARDTVRAAARRYGYSATDLEQWDLVIEEAVSNVIQLAYSPGENASFDVDCLQGSTGLTVRIRDRGRPFDPRRIQPIAFGVTPEQTPQRGLGWHLMQRVMDVVTLESLGREGKQLTLFKAAPPRFELGSSPSATGAPAGQPIDASDDVRYRKAVADDAMEVIRLFYDCYRYSYFNDLVYSPEALADMMVKGEIDSFVAEMPDGRLIGHTALIHYPDRPLAVEYGMSATDPAYRGHGVLGKLVQLANMEFLRTGKKVGFGSIVTVHTASQRVAIQNGTNECGLMLGAVPAQTFADLDVKGQGRGTIVFMAALIGSRPLPQLVLPPQHEAFIVRLYQQCRIAFGRGVAAPAAEEHTDATVSVRPKAGVVRISVNRIGADFIQRIRAMMHAARQSRTEVGQLFLPLCDPALPDAMAALEPLGWFVTGMMPEGGPAGDVLIVHWLNGWAMDYDTIEMARDEGRQLLAEVRSRDPECR